MIQSTSFNSSAKLSSVAPAPAITEPFGEIEFTAFQQVVETSTGIVLSQYKADQMRRRIASLAEKAGCTSFSTYGKLILKDSSALASFLDTMTINVTELMRNPERFEELAKLVLPELIARRKPNPLSIWSAGCSYGAEAYTVAMLLHEQDPAAAHKIKGTDLDLAVLAKADRPTFSATDMLGVSSARKAEHFHEMFGSFQPKIHLKSKVRFSRHDLLADHYPQEEYDLVLCRNVVIYFTDDAKERIFEGFYRSLRPGGVLFVGGTERLSNHRAIGFELIRPFFYRKLK